MNFKFNKDNTYCICLESLPKRTEDLKKRLKLFDLEYNIVKASTPNDLTDRFVDNLSPTQKACAQSHINIWKKIKRNGLEYALILEDDACFDKDWLKKLEKFSEDVKDDSWDAIFLNVSEPEQTLNKWVQAREQYLTGGYILSLRGAIKLLEVFNNVKCSADWMTSRLQLFNHCYTYFPWLIIQEGKESTIGSGVEADHAKVLRCLNQINYSLDNYVI